MDLKVEELFVMVQQMQTTNQAVLQRLDRMSDDTRRTCDRCQCSKHLEDALSEIKSLKSRVQLLEEQDTVSGQSVKSAEAHLQELNAKLEKIALNVQTDDSKLKRFELVGGKTTPNAQLTSHSLHHKQDSVLKTSSNQAEKISEATVMTCQVETAKPNFVNEDVTRTEQPVQSGACAKNEAHEELETDSKNQMSSIEVVGQEKNLPLRNTSKEEAKVLTLRPETPIKAQSVQRPRTGNIAKPNFGAREHANILEVEIVEQKEQKSYFSSLDWEIQAQHELQSAKQTELRHLRGIHDVILLDISASMASAWSQVRTFINDFLNGLEDTAQKGINKENVALVTFGHETKVQQRLTNNFSEIRQAFCRLKVGGPSPLNAGMMFALAAAASPDSFACSINGIHQGTRFILITDGEPTDPFTHQGPDIPDSRREEETKTHIVLYMEKIQEMQGELCCVPVGNANREFLSTLVSFCDGKIVDYTGGRQLSRKVFLMVQPGSLAMGFGFGQPFLSRRGEDLSEEDRRDIEEFGKKERRRLESGIRERNNSYLESTNKKLPKVGSRVRRGPDWHYDNQDSEGPGTVIGHCMGDERVFVNWDTNNYIDIYHYGEMHQYDILLVDEPRRLGPGETIAVGCIVSPGPFWKPQDGVATTDTGVVIKLELGPSNKPQATVRWDNGKRGDYLYDVDDKPEIQVCFETHVVTQSGEKQHSLPPPKKSKNKNKNKNVT